MSKSNLIPEDWEAARAVLRRRPVPENQRQKSLEVLAITHSQMGDYQFGLLFQLREPRHPAEQLLKEVAQRQAEVPEFNKLLADCEQPPLAPETVEWWYGEFEERLSWLGKFWGAVTSRAYQLRVGLDCTESLDQLERYLKESIRSVLFSGKVFTLVMRLAEEVRIQHQLGMAQAGDWTEASAIGLAARMTIDASLLWEESLAIAERSASDRRYEYESTPEGVMAEGISKWPLPTTVSALLRAERAAMRLSRPSSTASPARVQPKGEAAAGLQVSAPATPGTDAPSMSEPEVTGSKEKNPAKYRNIDFERWAVGLEDGAKWWLFRITPSGGWRLSRQIAVPGGRPSKLLAAFAGAGGALSQKSAIKAAQRDYPGQGSQQVAEKLTYALSDIRRVIRAEIGDVEDCECGGDPIPLVGGVWRASIHVGYAVQGDKGALTFQSIEEIDPSAGAAPP